MMNCPNCATENPQEARFCFNCGTPLAVECSNCGTSLQAGARFCHHCGQPAGAAETTGAPPPLSTDATLERYLPQGLLAKLESARNSRHMVGERKVVTILFCDVQGSTAAAANLDPEEWAEIINGAFEHMIQPIYHYEGTVARLQGDGVLAFFGAPIAHEDDPERAVLAGLEIVASIQPYSEQIRTRWGIDLNVRVGINTGLVVVGEVGSDLRVEYTALGDAINRAALMEKFAQPGTVLVAEPTYKLVAPLFEAEVVEGLAMTGQEGTFSAYRPIRPKTQRGRLRGLAGIAAPLVGREEQMETLRSAAAELRQGRGQIVSVMGEAGLGKSRLVSEFHQSLQEAGDIPLQWMEGRALSYQTTAPFAPFIDLFTRMFSQDAGGQPMTYPHLLEQLQERLDGQAGEIAPFFGSLLGMPLEGEAAERVKYIPPPRLRAQLFTHITTVMERLLATGPVVLYLDDLHWCDPTSIELLQALLPLTDQAPLMVLAAFRPRRGELAWGFHLEAERAYSHRYYQIQLEPLSGPQASALVASLLEIDDLPDEVRKKILEKADGNPFFVEEVIRSLLDNQLVVKIDGHWQATQEIHDIHLPDTLVGVITARMDLLGDQARFILQAAAVLGREFSISVLGEITEVGSQQLEAGLDELQGRDLVREKSQLPQRTFTFKHVLTREAAYQSILLSNRRELHRLAAEALTTRTPEAAAEIAHHLLAARLPGRALPFLVEAGDQANRAYAVEEAIGYFRQALDNQKAADELALVRRAYEGMGRALSFANHIPEAVESLKEMRALAETQGDTAMQISAINKLASITALNLGQFPEAKQLLAQAEQLSREHDEKSGVPETNLLYCQMCTAQADFDQVVTFMDEVIAVGQELDSPEYIAMGLDHIATSLAYLTQFDEAQRRAEQGLEVARSIGDREHEAFILGIPLPLSAFHKGELDEAEGYLRQALEIATNIGLLEVQALVGYLLGEVARWRGEYETALKYGYSALETALPLEEFLPFVLVPVLGSLGMIYLEISPQFTDKIAEFHLHALRLLESPIGRMTGGLAWADLGLCAIELGDLEIARDALDKGLHVPNMFSRIERPRHLGGTALLACTQGELEEAVSLADEAREYAEARQLRQHYPLTALIQGKVRAAAGQSERALAALDQAVLEAETLRMRPILWQAHTAAAEVLEAAGRLPEAEAKRAQARGVVAEIGDLIHDRKLRTAFLGNALEKITGG
jgi:class 3 adenylate cyclase/tetratricopeptide (TPR) repeat protein